MIFSVIVPVYNAEKTLSELLNSLQCQVYDKKFEVIIIDDCSNDDSRKICEAYKVTLIQSKQNSGPAVCRNMGVRRASGDILVFTDSDCQVSINWLSGLEKVFRADNIDAVMGNLIIPESTYLGDSISALGFPAGGSLGFEKVWKVDVEGYTNSLSTCNCAVRKDVFNAIGGFDETFPYPGGEDTLLAYNLVNRNYRIKYCSEIIVYHGPRKKIIDFVRWQYNRGISSCLFAGKVQEKSAFIKQRLWSIKNIFIRFITDKKIPLIIVLLIIGYCAQISGYFLTRINSPTPKK